jgi:hypothetical protein
MAPAKGVRLARPLHKGVRLTRPLRKGSASPDPDVLRKPGPPGRVRDLHVSTRTPETQGQYPAR